MGFLDLAANRRIKIDEIDIKEFDCRDNPWVSSNLIACLRNDVRPFLPQTRLLSFPPQAYPFPSYSGFHFAFPGL